VTDPTTDKRKKVKVRIHNPPLDPDTHRALRVVAAEEGLTMHDAAALMIATHPRVLAVKRRM
jgi:hypothetical protein